MKRRLDHSAIIHSSIMNRNYINVFKIGATLKEKIDPNILQKAADLMIKRFPLICVKLTREHHWFYLETLSQIRVIKDQQSVLSYINYKNVYQQAIVILYDDKQISVEFFHSVTDGYDGLYFLKALVGEYLKIKYDMKIKEDWSCRSKQIEDSYLKYARNHRMIKEHIAHKCYFHFKKDIKDRSIQVTTFTLSVQDLKEKAHAYQTSITVYIVALFFQAIMQMEKNKDICLMVPIDLRRIFPSQSLRNFSYFALVTINAKEIQSIDDLIININDQIHFQKTQQYLTHCITNNVRLQQKKIIDIMPLCLKNFFLRLGFYLNNHSCMTISNLGIVEFYYKEIEKYIESMDFILSPRYHSPYNCGIITMNDEVHINVTHNKTDKELVERMKEQLDSIKI